jgi:diguanylate cyclase (GGDEF)-like protein
VIPLLALYTFGITKVERSVAREVLMSAMVIMVAASVVFITSLSDHPNADHYHFGIILVVLFGNIVLKLRPRAAIVSSLVITSIYAILLTHMNSLAAEVRSNDLLIFITSVVISLIASFQMDQDQRRAYLARIREQQRNDELIDTVEQLGKLSAEDPLTEIANRREFDRRLKMEWGRARRETQPLALILVDVDFFKSYNDNYGHPAGDVCLQRVASTLCSVPQRSTDLVARLGGEEFVVLLPGTSVNDAAQLAEQMRRAILELNAEHIGSTAAPVVSASFGVTAILPGPQDEQAQLLANADVALYNAKKNGRNRVVIHAAP